MNKNNFSNNLKLQNWILSSLSFYSPKAMEDLIFQFDPNLWEKNSSAITLEDLQIGLSKLLKAGQVLSFKKGHSTYWLRIMLPRLPLILGGKRVPFWSYRLWFFFWGFRKFLNN